MIESNEHHAPQFLGKYYTDYQTIDCGAALSLVDAIKTAKISPENVVKTILLIDDQGEQLLAIVPFYSSVDLKFISQIFNNHFRIQSNEETKQFFSNYKGSSYPPFSERCNIRSIIDESLFTREEIIFQPGASKPLIRISIATFRHLMSKNNSAPIALTKGIPDALISSNTRVNIKNPIDTHIGNIDSSCLKINKINTHTFENKIPPKGEQLDTKGNDILGLIDELKNLVDPNQKLPQLTRTSKDLVDSLSNPLSTPQHVTTALANDPQLATLVLRYARATCFTYSDKINTIDEAVNHSLGMDLVSCIALGASTIKTFRTPRKGPLGYIALWRQAMYSATLMHALARRIPNSRVRPSTAFLIGFTQHYGMLALGHMFQFKYQTLNKMLETQLDTSFDALKVHSKVLGPTLFALNPGYASLGAWLLSQWDMPEAVITCAGEQLNPNYKGEYSSYVKLTQLSNFLLTSNELGLLSNLSRDTLMKKTPSPHLYNKIIQEHWGQDNDLGISPEIIKEVMKTVLSGCEEIECLASRLAA